MAVENKTIFENPKAFRQQVRLAAVQVAALGDAELATALAYELEPFSKIPAADADVAWRESAESNATVKVYDVAVLHRRAGRRSNGQGGAKYLNAIVAAIALLTVAAVGVDYFILSSRKGELHREISAQMPLDVELRRLEDRERSLRNEARRIRERRVSEEAAQIRAGALRSAIPDALDAVAAVCGGKIVVKEISSPSPFELEIRAVAVTAENAAAIMAQLGDAVSAKGWGLEPTQLAANSAGTMVDFSFRLRPSDLRPSDQKEVR